MKRAFTLIEILCVIVILAIVAGLATVGVASSYERARIRDTAAHLRDLDGRARLLSATIGPIVLSVADDHTTVRLHAVETDELLATVQVPGAVTVHVETEGEPGQVVFDAMGRSADYAIALRALERVESWKVLGLSGQVVTEVSP